MNFLDNVIGMLSPRRACEREAWRIEWKQMRGYDAANHGRMNAGWTVHNESAEYTDKNKRDTIRARARDLERNSDVVNAILHAYKRNVVGKGYTLQAKTGDDELDEKIEHAWREWTKAKNCDVTGEQSFSQIMRMAINRKKVDGGILFIFRYTDEGITPFKLQAIEVDELDINQIVPRKKGNTVVGGIEYNPYRRAVGYYINRYDIEGWKTLDSVYVDAKDVYFFKVKNRPSQIREVSDLAHVLTRVRDANEFITAVSMKERIAACLSVFIKRAIPSGGYGRSGIKTETGMSYEGKTLMPGMIQSMGAGDEIQVVDPKNAGADATQFLKIMQSLIAAGEGISYEALSRDMSSATYSSARQNAIEDEATYAEDVELLMAFMSEVYERFLKSCEISGAIRIAGFWENQEKYINHSWTKAPKKWIDPSKEATADQVALQSGQKTFQDFCAEKGKDWKEAVRQMAELQNYAAEYGVDINKILFGSETEIESAEEGEGVIEDE